MDCCIDYYIWTVALVSGVVVYVFNGTRSLIREMHATTEAIYATAKEQQNAAGFLRK
jgi:hypothetical protein